MHALCLTGLQTAGCIYHDSGSSAKHCRRLLDNDLRPFLSCSCHVEWARCLRYGMVLLITNQTQVGTEWIQGKQNSKALRHEMWFRNSFCLISIHVTDKIKTGLQFTKVQFESPWKWLLQIFCSNPCTTDTKLRPQFWALYYSELHRRILENDMEFVDVVESAMFCRMPDNLAYSGLSKNF